MPGADFTGEDFGGRGMRMLSRMSPVKEFRLVRHGAALILIAALLSGCGSRQERAKAYYESGMALIAKNDDLGARLELLNAVKYDQNNVDVWRALAGIDERTSSKSIAIDLRRILELEPTDQKNRIRYAKLLFDGGATDAALKVVDGESAGSPPSAELRAIRAGILARLSDLNGATREAQRARDIDPNNLDAGLILAIDKLTKNDPAGALSILNALPAANASDLRVRLVKIRAFQAQRDIENVEKELAQVVSENPKNSNFRDQLIQLYLARGKSEEAEKQLRAAVALDPADSAAELNLVRFLITSRGLAAGRDELDARLKQGGDLFPYQVMLAEIDFSEGHSDKAISALNELSGSVDTQTRKSEVQVKLAEFKIAQKDTPAALTILNNVIQVDRRNTRALTLRASIEIDRGDIDAAVADLREALNDQPKNPQLLMLMATAYERGNKKELADRQYNDALKATNSNPAVVVQYAAFLQRQGDAARAENIISDATVTYPRSSELLLALAQMKVSRRDYDGVLEVAEKIRGLGNDRGVADQLRTVALAGKDDIDGSLAAFDKARSANPKSIESIGVVVAACLKNGRIDDANRLVAGALQKDPDNIDLLVLLGRVQTAGGKLDEAAKNLSAAIARQPKAGIAYGLLADVYIRQKKYQQAEAILQDGLKQFPGNFDFRLVLAGIMDAQGRHDDAIESYDALLKEQPNSTVAINNLVSLLLDYRTDKASIDRAISLGWILESSAVPQYQDTFGWAQYHKGDYKGAIASLEQAKTALANTASVRYHLGLAYAKDGRRDDAVRELKIANQLSGTDTALKARIQAAIAEQSTN